MAVDIKKYKFGIIGMGFLGNAITHGFGLHADIKIYDKFKEGYDILKNVVDHAEFIWMCLPTPMNMKNGEIDLDILEENLDKIHGMVKKENKKIIIIKSTVIPGTTAKFAEKYPKLNFTMNPEFLTARNNRLDFLCASRIIIGSDEEWISDRVEEVYRYRFGNSTTIFRTDTKSAELSKYSANCFFALKISYFNFVWEMCQALKLNFEEVKDMVLADGRIARSHTSVPGWDGKFSYGGHCFPKDINALICHAKEIGVDPELLEASWNQNLRLRPEKDWEELESAVSNRKDSDMRVVDEKEFYRISKSNNLTYDFDYFDIVYANNTKEFDWLEDNSYFVIDSEEIHAYVIKKGSKIP